MSSRPSKWNRLRSKPVSEALSRMGRRGKRRASVFAESENFGAGAICLPRAGEAGFPWNLSYGVAFQRKQVEV